MVLRIDGRRVIASVAVCLAAAGAMSAATARNLREPPRPGADIPMTQDMMTTGATQPTLVWGGPLPPEPIPGEAPVYVPSPSAYSSQPRPQPQPQFTPAEDFGRERSPEPKRVYRPEPEPEMVYEPEPRYAPAEEIYRRSEPEPFQTDEAMYEPDPGFAPEPGPESGGFAEEPQQERFGRPKEARRGARSGLEPIDDEGMGGARLYQPLDEASAPRDEPRLAPSSDLDARMDGGENALPPLDGPVDIDDGNGMSGYADVPREDPWAGLTEVTPGVAAPPVSRRAMVAPAGPILEGRVGRSPPRRAALEGRVRPQASRNEGGGKRSIFDFGRGALEQETPTGYRTMPQSEAMCRRQLQKLGVKFVDASSIQPSRSCGIDYPVKIHDIAPGIAMRPSATLNCEAALRVAQWMKEEVKPAARWKMLKRPTVLINASSYRCSRIAGSRSVSQHASGSALDVRGFKFSDGSIMEVEKKGFFSFREKSFQKAVRESACRYFGTVLGPGYNEDHADHLHLDTKQRRRGVCK